MISSPASSGSSLSIRCRAASPPPNSSTNSRLKWPLTISNEVNSRSRASRLRLWMPWRSRLMASTRSSRSVVSAVCWASTSCSSSSARRLTAPSRSRSRRSFSRLSSISAQRRQVGARLDLGETRHGVRLDLQHVVDFALDIGEPASRAFHALLGAGGRLARAGQCLQRNLRGAVGFRHRVLGRGQRVGGDLAGGFGRFDFADDGAALFREQGRGIVELGALGGDLGDAGFDGGDVRGAHRPCAPATGCVRR